MCQFAKNKHVVGEQSNSTVQRLRKTRNTVGTSHMNVDVKFRFQRRCMLAIHHWHCELNALVPLKMTARDHIYLEYKYKLLHSFP